MTFATHPERQFMQYLRGAGWIKARTLPRSVRTVKSLLQKGWIEKQHQGPKNEVFFRLTEKGLEAKKSSVPIQEQSRPAEGEEMSVPRTRWTPEEDELIRSMGTAGESAAAIAALLTRRIAPGGAQAGSVPQDQLGPFAARTEAEGKIPAPTTNC
jgi:DNA-binding MarR family transcriptional regulator